MDIISQEDNTQWSREVYTVSEFNQLVQKNLQVSFSMIAVSGELCSLYLAQSGHLYGVLKDRNSQIRFVCYQGVRKQISFELRDGMEVLFVGEAALYKPKGEFQFIIKKIEPLGLGALKLAFEQLKAKLQAEGLFCESQKKPLPKYPNCIGVITSSDGAVWHDILQVVQRRFPQMPIILYPTSVQGHNAPTEICAALTKATAENLASTYILARGGGSFSDLMAFNHEDVVRAVANFPFPIISAIGHETDVTLCDFAADIRAATPSIAAEIATPHQADILKHLKIFEDRIEKNLHTLLRSYEYKMDKIELIFQDRKELLMCLLQTLKDHEAQFSKLLLKKMNLQEKKLIVYEKILIEAMQKKAYSTLLDQERQLNRLHERLHRNIDKIFYHTQHQLHEIEKKMFCLNPSLKGKNLKITNSAGKEFTSSFQIHAGEKGLLSFADGVWEIVFIKRQESADQSNLEFN